MTNSLPPPSMLLVAVAARSRGSMLPVKVFFGLLLAAIVCGAYYFLRNRKELFSGRGSDPATDSPAAGNLRMWMVILILVHAGAILTIMIVEL